MDEDIKKLAARIFAEEGNRGFGNVELASDRALAQFSLAGQDGAQNLVDKAFHALEDSDRDRARRYLRTAARLPFDDREDSHPLAWTAHMELFNLISDTVEDAEEGDSRWLDVAIELLQDSEEPAHTELRDVLRIIDQDYRLDRRESRALRAAIAEVPARPALPDQRPSETELSESALAVIDLCRAYHQAMEHSAG